MELKVYVHRLSQPARAVLLFCKMAGIQFQEVFIDLTMKQQKTPEFLEINPLGQVPAISHADFNLFESHAILVYLASAFRGIADHWYPSDLLKRAKIHSVLDWHHSNLRRSAAAYVMNSALAPVIGLPLNPQAAAKFDKLLCASLSTIDSVWLRGSGPFLLGADLPSIADLSLVCEIMELEVLDEEDKNRILGPHKKVKQWIKDTKQVTLPHFDEVHNVLFKTKARFQKQRSMSAATLQSKM